MCIGGMLTAIAVLFQSAPIFLPAIGLALSPFSTLPIAIATIINFFLGLTVFLSSAFLLTIVSLQETMIFCFTTGLLGIVVGALLYRKKFIISTLCSSIALSLGMVFLTYIIGIPSFVEFTSSLSIPITLLIFFLFSLIYSGIWTVVLRKYLDYFNKIKIME